MDNINTDGASNLGVCGASGGKDNDPDEESDGKRLLGGLSSLEESTNIPSRKCTPEHHPESSASNTGPLSRLARRVKSKFSRDRNPIPEKATFISYVDLYTIFDSKGQVHVTADNKEYLLKMLKEKSEKAYYDRIFEGMEGATLYNERYFEEILAKIRMEDKTAAAAAAAIESLQRLKVSVQHDDSRRHAGNTDTAMKNQSSESSSELEQELAGFEKSLDGLIEELQEQMDNIGKNSPPSSSEAPKK